MDLMLADMATGIGAAPADSIPRRRSAFHSFVLFPVTASAFAIALWAFLRMARSVKTAVQISYGAVPSVAPGITLEILNARFAEA
jgi:hypothetical protein